ncbi:MAG: uroporphyrinogen-III C-methyltransferase [Pirellulales bacterium]
MNELLGKVFLIGAGPGDPGLITVRGRELLARADVVLYDYLASPLLLQHCRADSERICLGQHGRGKLWTQEEINARMIADARAGRLVARLKGGDPAIFGRLAEELSALVAARIPHEVVPGVSAATAVASFTGLSLTDRDAASSVTFFTGQESGGKSATEALDFTALAKLPGTLVVYMGVTTAPVWSEQLLLHGKSPATPVIIVRRASLPDQQTWHTTLAEVANLLAPGEIRPPVLAIIGDVAVQRQAENWFTSRPLFGQTVLITRPENQGGSLADQLRELGARMLVQPAIEIAPPEDWRTIDAAIDRLSDFDWLVFSSCNGVKFFLQRLDERDLDGRAIGHAKLAAIGPATVAALAEYHLRADLVPDEYRAEALAEALAPHARQGAGFLLLRASRGREVLSEMLTAAGGSVEQVVVYESRDVPTADPQILAALQAGQIDWTTVTSSAIARSLVRLFGEDLRRTQLLAISPLTADVLRESGFPPALVSSRYTTQGMLDALSRQAERL